MNDLPRWIRAACNPEGSCLELARLDNGDVMMRNSRDPDGTRLVFTQAEIAAFIDGAKEGEFDGFLSEADGPYLAVIVRPARDLISSD